MRKTRKQVTILGRITAAVVLGLLITYTAFPGVQKADAAASCSTIADCTNQINASNTAVRDLQSQAVSYQDAVSRLQSQINIVEGQISESRHQQALLEQQIADAQTQLDQQKKVLSEILRTMYIDGQMTTIEALATSNSLSEYVDKEAYRQQVQNSVENTMRKIADLQSQLQSKKAQVISLLSQQQSQANVLNADKQQQSNLLSYNKSQQAVYNAQTRQNQAKLSALIAAQRSVNNSSAGGYFFIRFPGAVHSFNDAAYPYANWGFSMSTAPGCNDGDGPDQWGYCTRQCVSYAAWAVEASGRTAPKYWSNAKDWVSHARSAGVPIYNTPEPGDVAISTKGTWGHAMYVEQVSGNMIYVAQYNQQLTGQFSHQWRAWE
jgi:surface antigen/peptidoglycan hydrolase CwlO-like protein